MICSHMYTLVDVMGLQIRVIERELKEYYEAEDAKREAEEQKKLEEEAQQKMVAEAQPPTLAAVAQPATEAASKVASPKKLNPAEAGSKVMDMEITSPTI